ncbi:MAG TPA: GDSL-type esterase/lipase family protein [Myxococcota bacterium]|nr:GDSL-type esterase/lipase family protein [Myxococcota bacterium]
MLARLAAVALGVLLSVLLLALVELSLRAFGVAAGTPRHDPFAGFGSSVPMFEPVDATTMRLAPARLIGGRVELDPEDGREFLRQRRPHSFRAFVIGESSAAGVPYPPRLSFAAWLERLLAVALPDLHVEVVNAALSGYASRRLLPVVQEIAGYEPDLVIFYLGHNEWAERTYYAHLIDLDPRLFRLWQWGVDTRLYRVFSGWYRAGRNPFGNPPTLEKDAYTNSLEMFAVLQDRAGGQQIATARDLAYRDLLYEHNLDAMADLAQAAGARTLFLTLSQNFSDWAPGASRHRADLAPASLERFDALVARGRQARDRGDCGAALEAFSEALAIDAEFAELHFELAACQRALGELEAARRHYRLASDLDRVPHGAPTWFNDVVRRVARGHAAPVVDVDALFEAESGPALVGDDFFVDWLHPNLRGHMRIAEAIAAEMRRDGIPIENGGWRDLPPLPMLTPDPPLRVREEEMRLRACTLALRDACVRTTAEALLRLDPEHAEARAALARW